MEPNFNHETMAASSMQVDDSVKSQIVERIKAQMEKETLEPRPWPPIYLKAPDDWA